jgi:hypothetical protein
MIQTEGGRLCIASRSGVVWIDSDDPKTGAARTDVFVQSISIDGKLTRDILVAGACLPGSAGVWLAPGRASALGAGGARSDQQK